jgi:formiminotetrahydrofolate cyclodeaminase
VKNILPAYQTPTLDLNRQQSISKFLSRIATLLVRTYIRVVTLLPPLVEQGKLKIASDIAQLEAILHAIIPKRKAELKAELTRFKDLLFANHGTK